MLKSFRHLRTAIFVSRKMVAAEDFLARGHARESWSLLEQVAERLAHPWPNTELPFYSNLQVAVAALNVDRHFISRACAQVAQASLVDEPLGDADRSYLMYYAVMVGRMATTRLEASLPDKFTAYPPLSQTEVDRVSRRWRTKFPLAQISPDEVP